MSDPFKDISEFLEKNPVPVGPPKPPTAAPKPTASVDMGQQGMTRERHNLRDPDTENKWELAAADALDNMDWGLLGVSRGMLQIPTIGNADELAGAVAAATGGSYAEGRNAYRAQGAKINEAAPGTETAGELIAGGAVGGPAKLYQQMLMGGAYGVGAAPEVEDIPLYSAYGAAAPVALAAPGAAIRGAQAVGGAIGNVVRDAVHSPNAPQVASTILAKVGGGVSGSTAGSMADAVLPIPGAGSALGGAIGTATAKPNAVTDAAGAKMVTYLRSKIMPRKVAFPTADTNYTLPQRPTASLQEEIPVPAESAPVWPPPRTPDVAQPPATLSMPPAPPPVDVLPKRPLSMAPEPIPVSDPLSISPTSPYTPKGVQSLDDFLGPESAAPAKIPAPFGADPHAYPSRIPTASQVEGPNYFDFKLPPPAAAPPAPIETLNTLRPPRLPELAPSAQATSPYIPGARPIPPSIQEPPSFAAINAPTTPWKPPTPTAQQVAPRFTQRLEQAASMTQDPAVLTTLEKIATLEATDPVRAAARHTVELSKNPAYRETMRIIEGK